MSFTLDWLDLREGADHRARDVRLAHLAAEHLAAAVDPLVVDLGAGSGSTLRALAPRLSRPVRWRLVDADAELLAEAGRRAAATGVGPVETAVADLAGPAPLPLQDATLVTASALTDLVSETFLARLVAAAASRRAGLYAALGYDGVMRFEPVHPLDEPVRAAFNRDQRRDKGFGPALGPDGTARLAEIAERAGYRVDTAASPWELGPDDAELVRRLVEGIAAAAAATLDPEAVDTWLAARLEAADTGSATIGHLDVLALPG